MSSKRRYNPPIFNLHNFKLEDYNFENQQHIFPTYYMSRAHIEWTPNNNLYSETSSEKNMNAGDLFTEFIINNLSNGFYYKFTINGPESSNGSILCKERYLICGSLLQDSMPNSILCGVGAIRKNNLKPIKFKECYGVRGKLSLEILKNHNSQYNYSEVCLGDPGLLLSYFFPHKNIEKKYKFGIILHMGDINLLNQYFDNKFLEKCKILDIRTDNFKKLSLDICECEIIITSTLHGMIFAHSYNIETIWIELDKSILCGQKSDNIKFFDHLSIFDNNFKYDLNNRVKNGNINNWINYKINESNVNSLTRYKPQLKEVDEKINDILKMMKKIIYEFESKN